MFNSEYSFLYKIVLLTFTKKKNIYYYTGKRVVHSELTKKKLAEVQKVLDMDAMVLN